MSLDAKLLEVAKAFFHEARDGLERIEQGLLHLGDGTDREQLDAVFRAAHSIKGGAAIFGQPGIASFMHGVETVLDRIRTGVQPADARSVQTLLRACDVLRDMIGAAEAGAALDQERATAVVRDIEALIVSLKPAPRTATPTTARASGTAQHRVAPEAASIRVSTERVDQIINLVGQLVITQSTLCTLFEAAANDLEALRAAFAQLARTTRELQEAVMHVRMLPISFAFNRLPRLVHDLTVTLGKQVELHIVGESTEIDKSVLDKLTDPLVHLVRNALDHGLETPSVRRASGKAETGRLEIAAYHDGGNIVVEVRDDGAGLDSEKIRRKALDHGLILADQEFTTEQINNLIFLPGFSTAEQVSDISGRGVGMDVVKRNINELGGRVSMTSRRGSGSTVRMRLPLTLAILDGQLVRVGNEIYVIPLLSIVESIQVKGENVNRIGPNAEMFRLRESHLRVIKLYELLDIRPDSYHAEQGLLVVIESEGVRAGLLVDEILSQQQVVIKSLEANFRQIEGLTGATILGDGRVALIIDAPALMKKTDAVSHAVSRQGPTGYSVWHRSQPTTSQKGQPA